MNSYLLNRQLGSVGPRVLTDAQNERLLQSLQQDSTVFTTRAGGATAHTTGVSSVCVDRFEGRYLLSGGADSSIAIWDLEQAKSSDKPDLMPLSFTANTSITASLGITHLSFYPFDSLAFLSSGYDQTLKLFSSETLQTSAKFDLGSTVFSHSCSTVADHVLVACATQHPTVRLVDLQTGASAHALAGHSGAVMTVAWHPRNGNILASGSTDGCIRLWDIRRSANSLGVLDLEDSIGVAGYDGAGTGARRRERGRAHTGSVNGITWSDDGSCLVSIGTDERMRVWDMTTGANTLANFGPSVKNARSTTLLPLIAPDHLSGSTSRTVFFPNPREILSFDLYTGNPIQRLRPNASSREKQLDTGSTHNIKSYTTSMAWRAHHIQMFSAHTDGTIRSWSPRTWEDEVADEEENDLSGRTEDQASKKRKREELEEIVRDLTTKKVTFT